MKNAALKGFVKMDNAKLHHIMLAMVLATTSSFATTGVWTGAGSDGKWTNADNWKDGVIPGRYTVSDVTQGDFGDTAVFGAVAAGGHTTVVLGNGLLTIGTIRITGADAPGYTFGNAANENQALKLEAGGGFVVDGDVVNAPTFMGYLYNATKVEGVSPTCITFENNSTQTLDLPVIQQETTSTQIAFKGSGDIRLNGEFKSNSESLILNQTGRLIVNTVLRSRVYGTYAPYGIKAGGETTLARIVINKDCKLHQRYQYGHYLDCTDGDIEISGEGEFVDNGYSASTSGFANGLVVTVPAGRTLTFASRFSTSQNTTVSDDFGFRVSTGGGTVRFSGMNAMLGYMDVYKVTVETPDAANSLGSRGVRLGYSGVLKYTGTGETMTTAIRLCSLDSAGTSGTLCHSGTGPWKIEDFAIDAAVNKNGTLGLAGEGDGAEIAAALADAENGKTLAITKKDAGTWTLSGVNTYTGVTTVNGGVLKVAATGSIAMSSELAVKGGTIEFEGVEEPTAQAVQKLTISDNSTLALSGKVTVTAASVSRTSGKVLDVVTDSADAKLVVPVGTAAGAFTWNGQPAIIGEDGEVKIDADAVIAARGDVVPDNGGKVVIFNPGTTGNDTLAADTTTLTKLTQLSKTASTVEIGANRTLVASAVALAAGAADLTLGAVGDKGALDSPTKVISFDNRSAESKITLNAAIGAGVTNEFAYGGAVIAGDTALGFTKIAIVDKAKSQLEVRGCTVETGFEPIQIGSNTGTDYSGGGMQYGELTVSNALIRNVVDLARASHSYSAPSDYGILVGKNASGILRVQDGAVISNKLQVGTGINGTSGRGSGAVYQSGGQVVTIGGGEYRQNVLGNAGMGYYELKGGSFNGLMAIGTYGIGIWHQEPGTTANMTELNLASANGGRADAYFRGMVTVTSGGKIGGGYQNGGISLLTIDGPAALVNGGSGSIYAFLSDTSAVNTSRVNVAHGGKIRCSRLYNNSKSGTPSRLTVSFDGGTFVCVYKNYQEVFGADRVDQRVDDIRVYSGGMTVETVDAGAANGTSVAIRRPEGKGVVSIPFDYASFAEWNCPPFIRIMGDGDGATAHALFDSSNQAVTGVVITCSGTGYTWAKATAIYGGNSCPSAKSVDCVIGDNARSGGFTKTGPGSFTLGAANTWGGATVAAGGTLKAGCDWAIPADSAVVLAGGKIDFGGKVGSVSKITYTVGGGSIMNAENVTLPTAFDLAITAEEVLAKKSVPLTGNQDLTGKTLTITGDFSSLDPEVCRKYTVVSVSGGAISGEPMIVAPALPKGWSFVTRPNGVRLVNPLGMMLLVR